MAVRRSLYVLQRVSLTGGRIKPNPRFRSAKSPIESRSRLGDDQSWIVVSEGNVFAWTGPDLRFARGEDPESVAYGYLPARLFEIVRDRFVAYHEKASARLVRRDE